jgi:hypothetical protein
VSGPDERDGATGPIAVRGFLSGHGYPPHVIAALMAEAQQFPGIWAYPADRSVCVCYHMPGGRWEALPCRASEERIAAAGGRKLPDPPMPMRDDDPRWAPGEGPPLVTPGLGWPPPRWDPGETYAVVLARGASRRQRALRWSGVIGGLCLVIAALLAAVFGVAIPQWAAVLAVVALGITLVSDSIGRGPLA